MNLGDGGMVEDEEVIKTLEELIIMLAMAASSSSSFCSSATLDFASCTKKKNLVERVRFLTIF